MKKTILILFLCLVILGCSQNPGALDYVMLGKNIISVFDETEEIVPVIIKNDLLYVYPKGNNLKFIINNKDYELKLTDEKFTCAIGEEKLNVVVIKQKPFLIITYDDCPSSDYGVYKELHKQYSPVVPAELGININRCSLSYDKMKEMVLDGFEIVNHSTGHNRLEAVGLQKAVNKGNNKIYGWFVHTFLNDAEIFIGSEKYTIKAHGSDESGNYFEVYPSFTRDYPVSTKIQLSDNQLNNELFYGLKNLEEKLSTKITNFTYPYTVSDEKTRDLLLNSGIYNSSRSYNGFLSDGKTKNLENPGMNYFPFDNRYNLNSASFDMDYTEDELLAILEKAVQTKAMIIQFNHSWDNNFNIAMLKFLIDNAKKMNIEITTRAPVFEYYELYK